MFERSVEIFVFSGTGNSLALARGILGELGGGRITMVTAELLSGPDPAAGADLVGFVFPVYFLDIPEPVRALLKRIAIPRESRLFAVGTAGRIAGPALEEVRRILALRERELTWSFVQVMPGNSVRFPTPPEKQPAVLSHADARASRIGRLIGEGRPVREDRAPGWAYPARRIMRWSYTGPCRIGEKGASPDGCTRCGVCARVCPQGNITLPGEGAAPLWGDRCANCFACLHWCPSNAVKVGTLKLTREQQYTHPRIGLNDLSPRTV